MNIFEIPTHPVADLFPMLDADEIAELAADIAQNGLLTPLMVSGTGEDMILIDGRNRRAACKLANVEPTTTPLEGDAVAYIVSANINRRHLTVGQRTMIVAKIYPEPGKGGRGKKSSNLEGFSSGRLAEARTILRVMPELADQVIKGGELFSVAYERAVKEQAEYGSVSKTMDRLKVKAPDLHELVQADKLTLVEASASLRAREDEARAIEAARIDGVLTGLKAIFTATEYVRDKKMVAQYRGFLNDEPEKVTIGGGAVAFKKAVESFVQLAKEIIE